MKFYILASVIIFCAVIYHATRRNTRLHEKEEKAFWERERQANETRKKSLDDLVFIEVPLESFPTDLLQENETVQGYIDTIRGLTESGIVNLTGYTNTDLKLKYGTANITKLSQYDQNYTILVSTLQQWADALLEEAQSGVTSAAVNPSANAYITGATAIMEFAVSTKTDVSRTYYRLAEYYQTCGDDRKLENLIKTAEGLRSANKNVILGHLKTV